MSTYLIVVNFAPPQRNQRSFGIPSAET